MRCNFTAVILPILIIVVIVIIIIFRIIVITPTIECPPHNWFKLQLNDMTDKPGHERQQLNAIKREQRRKKPSRALHKIKHQDPGTLAQGGPEGLGGTS